MPPTDDLSLLQTAVAHHNAGRLSEAEAIYREILARQPKNPDALSLLGVIAGQTGHPDTAVDLISRAIAIRPDIPVFYQSLAESFRRLGRLDHAIAALHRALALDPNSFATLLSLGNMQVQTGAFSDALGTFSHLRSIDPNSLAGHTNYGGCLLNLFRPAEAVGPLRRAIAIDPNFADAHSNLGRALLDLNDSTSAIPAFRKAIALRPDHAAAHFNLGCALLLRGQFAEGWAELDWRWKTPEHRSPRYEFGVPQWDGQTTNGRTILIHCEQGFGDSIQFIRYIPLLIERGAKVIVLCQPEVMRLFRSVKGNPTLLSSFPPLPPFDFHCPLLTLPRLFNTDIKTIPSDVPYLSADSSDVEHWKAQVAQKSKVLKIGLAWAGNPAHHNDRNRSIPLERFAPLAGTDNTAFFSLQKRSDDSPSPPPTSGLQLIDFTPRLSEFADTAALIANLDLVISVDSAVAHVAGALGKPVWLLLPYAPDWRWLTDRTDSAWYPTMRLYRQPALGDWVTPLSAIARDLAARRL